MTGPALVDESTNRLRTVIDVHLDRLRKALDLLDPKLSIRPRNKRLLVLFLPEDEVQKSGLIYRVDQKAEKRARRCIVLAVAEDCKEGLEPDDLIIVDAFVGQYLPHWGADSVGLDLRLVPEADCLAILDG